MSADEPGYDRGRFVAGLRWGAAGALLVAVAISGCASYRVGARSLYPPDIQTVYVPMFESNSFRRNLGERLTEAVMKEIELKTPYKVVSSPNADSVLSGRIVADTKRFLVESPTDEGRELQVEFVAQITWVDRKGELIKKAETLQLPAALGNVSQAANIVPEVGQTVATAQQQAIQRLAEQIVSLMESPW